MQYERSEDGIDYVNAFPISIQEDADLTPLMERLLDKQLSSAKVFCSSVPEKQLSRLVITEKYDIILPDYHNMQIKMEPLIKLYSSSSCAMRRASYSRAFPNIEKSNTPSISPFAPSRKSQCIYLQRRFARA